MLATIALLSYAITSSFGPTQSPGPPGWDVLAQESSMVVVGGVEGKSWVVRKGRMSSSGNVLPTTTLSD